MYLAYTIFYVRKYNVHLGIHINTQTLLHVLTEWCTGSRCASCPGAVFVRSWCCPALSCPVLPSPQRSCLSSPCFSYGNPEAASHASRTSHASLASPGCWQGRQRVALAVRQRQSGGSRPRTTSSTSVLTAKNDPPLVSSILSLNTSVHV